MGLLGLGYDANKQPRRDEPPKGARPQQQGGHKVATNQNWKQVEGSVGHMAGRVQAGAEGVVIDSQRKAGGDHGVLSGLGNEVTATQMVATKDQYGREILCRVEIDRATGREILVPIEGGERSAPIAGRCVAVYDRARNCEVMCRVMIGRDGKEYLQEIE